MRDPKKVRSRKKPITSSSNRSSRSKAGASSAAKKTTSSGRGAGRTPTVDSRVQRQRASSAKVTQSGGGTRGSAKVTYGSGKASAAGKVAGAAKAVPHVAAAAAGLNAGKVADGTLKGKPTGPNQGPKTPQRLTQKGIDSKSFDDAFRQARKAGQKVFTWRGKSYNTKMA